jgi:NADPH-dependent 2,4-dienoyl-CoA reductase/sulfur reductase-like enzyme
VDSSVDSLADTVAERLVVIGGDAAGMATAMNARRQRADLEIVAFERGTRTSYSACGIPYLVSGEVEPLDALVARTPREFREAHRIDVRVQHEVTDVDLDRRQVEVHDLGHGRTFRISFDHLLIGTGARPTRPDLPGIDGEGILGVQTLDDAAALLAYAEQSRCQRVVVVGAGYIGLEMAEAFVMWGAEVTLVDASPEVMRTLDPDMAALVHAALERHSIQVRTGVAVTGFAPGAVHTADGPIPTDLVVLGLGVTPNAQLAEAAGLELGVRGAIRVDRRQQTSVEGIWAAGDCAESHHLVSERPVHVALGTVANHQGRVAGINIAGGYARFPGVVGTAITKVCSTEVARTGLTEVEAARDGFQVVAATIETTTRAGYHPAAAPITVKLVAEVGSGRVLGGQIVGGDGSAKRIDTLATAITARMTVEDVINLDLAYAPPFSPVWDPVATAARVAARQLAGRDHEAAPGSTARN